MVKKQGWVLKGRRLTERSKRLPFLAPMGSEQRIYEKYIKKCQNNSNALVLGATPEPRDLAIKNNLKCYAVDISKPMLDKFTLLMKYKKNKNNIIKNGDWLNMRYKKGFFSIAMGDGSLNNLATRRENENLFKILEKQVAPKGYLLLRQVIKNTLKPIHPKKVVKLFRKKKIGFPDFFGEFRVVLPINTKIYNKKTFQLKADDVFDLIELGYKKQILNKDERDLLFAYKNDITNTFYPENEFLKLAQKHGFKLVEIFADNRYRFTNYLRMYVFRKND